MLIFQHFRPARQKLPLFTDDTRRLTMPVLAVVGGQDVIFDSRHSAQRLAHTAPQATIRFLPEARHVLPHQTIEVLDFLLTSNGHQSISRTTDLASTNTFPPTPWSVLPPNAPPATKSPPGCERGPRLHCIDDEGP